MEKKAVFDYSVLESLGFTKDTVSYNKYIYDKDRKPMSVDFTFFCVIDNPPRLRVFFNDHSNWFDIYSYEQFKIIYDFYSNYSYEIYYNRVDREYLESLGFHQLYKERNDILTKQFDKFEITIIGGYWVHTKYKVQEPYNDEIAYDYVDSKEKFQELIDFYNTVL